jgi:formylglycine-generating enzyme required for sulfatase activity
MNSNLKIVLFIISMITGFAANADYNNTNGSKEAAIKGSGAYRQEFERRMSGTTGFENAAKGIQELSETINGPALPSKPSFGKSIGEYMADLVIQSLEVNATLKGIGIKNDDIIDAIDAYIKKNKKIDDSSLFINYVSEGYRWKGELLTGVRDPGVVEKDVKAGFKSYKKALEYNLESVDLGNKYISDPAKHRKVDVNTMRFKYILAKMTMSGLGTSKDVPEAVKTFSEIIDANLLHGEDEVYLSYCSLISIYAYGSEGFPKNVDKVLEYAQRAAELSVKTKADRVENWNSHPVCVGAQTFIQPIVAELKEIAAVAALEKTKSAKPLRKFKDCPDCPEVVEVPEGEFEMGHAYEHHQTPLHKVTISSRFAIGKTEVTRGQFAAFVKDSKFEVGNNCDAWKGIKERSWQNLTFKQDDSHPVVCVSLSEAKAYAEWLSKKTKKHYQIPTEAQWEYACRSGQEYEYCGDNNVDAIAWYADNSSDSTHPVAKKKPNNWGAFDMNGNAGEWVSDPYHSDYYNAPSDGSEWVGNSAERIVRGGSWGNVQGSLPSSFRGTADSDQFRFSTTGFRVVRVGQ